MNFEIKLCKEELSQVKQPNVDVAAVPLSGKIIAPWTEKDRPLDDLVDQV